MIKYSAASIHNLFQEKKVRAPNIFDRERVFAISLKLSNIELIITSINQFLFCSALQKKFSIKISLRNMNLSHCKLSQLIRRLSSQMLAQKKVLEPIQ